MSAHTILNARPQPKEIDGELWMPFSYVERLEEQMRGEMRARSELRGYMATIRELWKNIPEHLMRMPYAQSADVFRKHALIKTGWCEVDSIVFETVEQAVKQVGVIRYRARMGYGYAITIAQGNVVVCSTPLSQSLKGMGQEDFKKSKGDVLDFCRGVVGVTE